MRSAAPGAVGPSHFKSTALHHRRARTTAAGFAFKKDTGDTRETPAIDVCHGLMGDGARVRWGCCEGGAGRALGEQWQVEGKKGGRWARGEHGWRSALGRRSVLQLSPAEMCGGRGDGCELTGYHCSRPQLCIYDPKVEEEQVRHLALGCCVGATCGG